MYFVLITLICNLPSIAVEALQGVCPLFPNQIDIQELKKLDNLYLTQLQFSCSFWILLLTLSDPFTY